MFTDSAIIGIGATVFMDLWSMLLQRTLGIVPLNYALVGRWLGTMTSGVFAHDNIRAVKPVAAESAIGWITHYLIGVIFAAALIIFTGNAWVVTPSIAPALLFGVLTVAFPFFLMQPCLGLGIAAAKTPKPNIARLRSLLTHTVFGLGLYITAIFNILFLQ